MIVVGGEMLVDLVPLGHTHEGAPGPDLRPALGGGPFNVAVTAGRQGANVQFLSRVSRDQYGRAGIDRLVESGVETSLIQRGDEPTTVALASVDDNGAATYVFHWAGSADRFVKDPGPIVADVCCFGTLSLVFEPGATSYETIMIRQARAGNVICLDPNIRPSIVDDSYRSRFHSWLEYTTVLKLSDDDTAWLIDEDTDQPVTTERIHDACREWLTQGPAAVILTEGSRGLSVITEQGDLHIDAPEVTVADTIGAGDTIMGTIVACIDAEVAGMANPAEQVSSWGQSMWEGIAEKAVRAAAITVSRPGANPPLASELS